ncbi:serine O-acetyltransferase [Zobellia laminariae]|uniref:serine acetyltransferase n=1 Tax=Zobellia laminariae TaxID=248906 RepID=UPI0012D97409|nr:serine acetyltransferase [Zobellia laminariae]
MKNKLIILSALRLFPHILLFNLHKNKQIIHYDVERWLSNTDSTKNIQLGFLTLMTIFPEYRNLFYKRIGGISSLINWLCPRMNTLFILTDDIGPGLFIQHGFSTIIAAKSIGRDCWINQQVTIGFSNKTDSPELGDNVTINAGAKIIGKVKMGNNSKAGANSVVVKDVPENCTVVGIPAYIIRRNGIKVKEEL